MQKRLGALGAALLGSFVIVACVAAFTTNGSHPSPGPTHSSSPSPTPEMNGYVAAMVPADIKSQGSVKVAVAVGSSGLNDALAAALGHMMGVQWVTVSVSRSASSNDANDTVITDVQSGMYDIGLSDLTENSNREKNVDFLTYLLNAPGGPQGIAFHKNYGLEKATQAALALLVADGEFQKIVSQGPSSATPITAADPVSIIAATS